MKRRIEILDFVKLLAILLIFNSHCDDLYPVSALATGGSIGNSLFFIIGGYFTNFDSGRSFPRYFLHRVARLYLAIWIATPIIQLIDGTAITSFSQLFLDYIYPTTYWITAGMVVFLLLLYFVQKIGGLQHFYIFSLCMLALYIAGYLAVADLTRWSVEDAGLTSPLQYFKCIHYFYIFALGYKLRNSESTLEKFSGAHNGIKYLLIAAAAFALQIAWKLLMKAYPALYCTQFLCQLMDIIFALAFFKGAIGLSDVYERKGSGFVRRIISKISDISFEIYAVQFIILGFCSRIFFPANVAAALGASILLGFVLHQIVTLILRVKLVRKPKA